MNHDEIKRQICEANPDILLVAFGCPKQEKWMLAHRGRVTAVMLGVGAAFDFIAGTLPRAPVWMQAAGLEWLHRLTSEPGRLWARYLVTNSLFVIGAALIGALGFDYRLEANGLCPRGWLRLRTPLSLGLGGLTLLIAIVL